MPDVTSQFELRQLLKAYRRGLISDDVFEEQLREIQRDGTSPTAAGKSYIQPKSASHDRRLAFQEMATGGSACLPRIRRYARLLTDNTGISPVLIAALCTGEMGALMLNVLAVWAPWVGMLLWLIAVVASFWLWGGARRNALGHLAAGSLALASGTLFIHVAVINAFARMDNAYLGNGLLGGYLVLAGVTLLLGALAGYGVHGWIAASLWLVIAAFAYVGIPWLANVFSFPDSGMLLFAALILGGVFLYVALRGHLAEAAVAIALAAAGLALAWWIYGGDLRAFVPVTSMDEPFYKPPVLDIEQFVPCLLIVTILFFAGRFIQPRLRGQRPIIRATRAPAPN